MFITPYLYSTGDELTPGAKYDFKFKDYAPWVFRHLREQFGIDPADYLVSIKKVPSGTTLVSFFAYLDLFDKQVHPIRIGLSWEKW